MPNLSAARPVRPSVSFAENQPAHDHLAGTIDKSLAPLAGFLPASHIVPPFIPIMFFFGLYKSSWRTYLSEVKALFLYVLQLGLSWPLPLSLPLIVNYCIYSVLTRNRSSSCVDRILAVVSRLADSHDAFACHRSESDSRLIGRLRRFLQLQRPLAPQGRDAIPDPANFVPRMLAHLGVALADELFRARFLILLNTGMRCAETSWENMLLTDVTVYFDAAGFIIYIELRIRFSKTTKTTAEPVYKFIFPRSDLLDAVRPLLRYIRRAFGIVPAPVPLAPGQPAPSLSTAPLPLFPCLAPGHSPMYQASGDTAVMTERMKHLAELAGMRPEDANRQDVHGMRSTFTTLLVQAGSSVAFSEQIVGWNASRYKSANRYLRIAAAHANWYEANRLLDSFFKRRRTALALPEAPKTVGSRR